MSSRIDELIHGIASAVGTKDENTVRKAAMKVVKFFLSSNYTEEQLLEYLLRYLINGEENRSIVHEFRSKLFELTVEAPFHAV